MNGRGAPRPTADVVVEDAPDSDELDLLEEMVRNATREITGIHDDRELAAFVRDGDGRVIGGISGGTWGGCCDLQLLWVDERWRGDGLGSALVAAAESEARRRGCNLAVLQTHDGQAAGFYERLGYQCVGVVDGYPAGSAARWYTKQLD